MLAVLLPLTSARAATPPAIPSIDPACLAVANEGIPAEYDEQAQVDYLANRWALASTLSPLHAPIPHEPGHGAIGAEAAGIPPASCSRRLVENYAKTVNANRSPVLPRFRMTFAFPKLGPIHPYAGFAYLPPIPVDGDTFVVTSGELGFGVPLGEQLQLGARFHASTVKMVGALSPPGLGQEAPIDDLFVASTFGGEASLGFALEDFVPYVSVGITDASTYYYVGEDNLVTNNYHPYLGPNASVGLDGLYQHLRFGVELYAAPGGYTLPDPNVISVSPKTRYGYFYTARLRLGYEL